MPLYEYRCSACGEAFELLRSMSAADQDLVCPKCQSERVARQLSVIAKPAASGFSEPMGPCGAPVSACGGSQGCPWKG